MRGIYTRFCFYDCLRCKKKNVSHNIGLIYTILISTNNLNTKEESLTPLLN